MNRLFLNLFIILMLAVPKLELGITPMEALDIVKERYATNYEKVDQYPNEEYYYKLASADYYLVYEGEVGEENNYLIHLYEFVISDYDTGLGHTVTYGWYTIDRKSGEIIEMVTYD